MVNKKVNAKELFGSRPKPSASKLPANFNRSDFSESSLEVLEHFGLEAPDLLNNYSIALEDAVIDLLETIKALRAELHNNQQSNDTQ